eukprot:4347983-Amphidinium_carterae.1
MPSSFQGITSKYRDTPTYLCCKGLQLVLEKIGLLMPFGLVWCAPPCSSWIWISRSTSKRSKVSIHGDESKFFVAAGNRTAEILAQLLVLCDKMGVYFIIEQPTSSLLWTHPSMTKALHILRDRTLTVRFKMSIFGSRTAKPTTLVGSAPFLSAIPLVPPVRQPTSLACLARKTSSGNVNGKTKELKLSAHYPMEFCHRVAGLLIQNGDEKLQVGRLILEPLFQRVHPYRTPVKCIMLIAQFL